VVVQTVPLKPIPASVASSTRVSSEASPGPEGEFEFSDVGALMCVLCARQFKTIEQLTRHNKESDLHKVSCNICVSYATNFVSTTCIQKNYKDSNLRDVARDKLTARKSGSTSEAPKYRDRASERRVLFNQPDAPMPEKEIITAAPSKRKHADALNIVAVASTPPAPIHPGKDESNVGNKLLKMMGWKEGTGLGSEGDGRVNPM